MNPTEFNMTATDLNITPVKIDNLVLAVYYLVA